jgi:PAS domain S-box-containing protein
MVAASRALIDALIEAVWLVDPVNLHIVDMNPAALELCGLAREDMLNRPVVELTATPEDLYFWEDVAAGLSEGIHSETLVRSADGIAIPVDRKVSRIWLDAATPLFMVGLRDLRQQRRTETALEAMVAELRATLESTADGILSCDGKGRVQNYNRHVRSGTLSGAAFGDRRCAAAGGAGRFQTAFRAYDGAAYATAIQPW